jgi:MFS family permease
LQTPLRTSGGRYLTLSFVIFSGFVALGSAGPFQALYAVSLGASLGQVALIAGGYTTVVRLFAGLAWGRLADDPRRRVPTIALALATMAAVVLLEAAVSLVSRDDLPTPVVPWMMLVPLRLIEGTAWAASQVASMAMMGDLLAGDARRPRLVSGVSDVGQPRVQCGHRRLGDRVAGISGTPRPMSWRPRSSWRAFSLR